ncbi:transglutaminase domain-containing protein [Nocardioides sp. W3-2-3]|uniref:transglutaminase-like domain-containing protein n=1 Tax=Nocardioides convexus TaxID=2712224 RepID=UPI0024189734|nr:transglutaminase-like domain-containing protein [Nocardioides convexus]NHA00099.1 transglutaminase domain-containing protein [Nocardioides convexus]
MDRVQRWQTEAGFSGGTDGLLAEFLRDSFREHGYYSDGIDDYTPAGHGASRLAVLTKTATPVGNAEQYAAAMALAGQRMGLPIRVVIGFKVPPGGGDVRGENVTAWTEVKAAGCRLGAPRPDPARGPEGCASPTTSPTRSRSRRCCSRRGCRASPRRPPTTSSRVTGSAASLDVLEVLGTIIGVVLDVGKVLLVLSPLWGVLLYSLLRRRRRRAGDPTARLTGAWRETRRPDARPRCPQGSRCDPAGECLRRRRALRRRAGGHAGPHRRPPRLRRRRADAGGGEGLLGRRRHRPAAHPQGDAVVAPAAGPVLARVGAVALRPGAGARPAAAHRPCGPHPGADRMDRAGRAPGVRARRTAALAAGPPLTDRPLTSDSHVTNDAGVVTPVTRRGLPACCPRSPVVSRSSRSSPRSRPCSPRPVRPVLPRPRRPTRSSPTPAARRWPTTRPVPSSRRVRCPTAWPGSRCR